ncbi:MAG: hypothetical protein AB8G99_06850 [Planctomycetaceae bacterium]
MNKTRLIQTSVFAVAAVGLCVLGSTAQERAGYATLSGRPASQPVGGGQQAPVRQVSSSRPIPLRTVSMPKPAGGCTNGGCAPMSAPVGNACGCAAPSTVVSGCAAPSTAFDNCGCDARVPFPAEGCGKAECGNGDACGVSGCGTVGCTTGGCSTGGCTDNACASTGCATEGCATGGCDTGSCPPAMASSWNAPAQQRRVMRQATRDRSYNAGYQRRMASVLGRSGSACGNGSGSCAPKQSFWTRSSASYQSRNARLSQHLFGWLIPSGNGGVGSPPIGKYHTTYAQDAHHFDQRDGELYSAQGYGTHITVPLAPNVRHQYNYGWGMPSSRITRVSQVAPYTSVRPLSW